MDRDTLITDNIGIAHKAARTVSRNPRYHDDIHASAVLGLVEAADTYQAERGPFPAWAWRCSYWRAVKQLQHLTKTETWLDLEDTYTVPDPNERTVETLDAVADTQRLLATINTEEQQLVCAVVGIGQAPQTIAAIARKHGKNRTAVSNKYQRTLQKLRETYNRQHTHT